jgi:chromosomal replication initiator protein
MQTFATWVELAEGRSARAAVGRVARCVCRGRALRGANPLFLHGPSGTGKTHLIAALVEHVGAEAPEIRIAVFAAKELTAPVETEEGSTTDPFRTARQADLIAVEDVQHLSPAGVEVLARMVDEAVAHRHQTVMTATAGPAQLENLPGRLASRLASGLVVGLEALGPPSRLAFLRQRAGQRRLKLEAAVLDWLAERLPGSARVLEGALSRIEMLQETHDPLTTAILEEQFAPEIDSHRPTVERIVSQVGRCFRVAPKDLQGPARSRSILLPRQVGMYLARQLTRLSLEQIGAYFGGRDHSTVLHACRKIEDALAHDARLSGTVRRLHADLA